MASTINATTSGIVTIGDSVATLALQTGGTTAVAIDTAQIVSLSKSLALLGSTSGSVTIAAPAVAGTQSYTLPTALPGTSGYALTSTTGGVMSWAAATVGKNKLINGAMLIDQRNGGATVTAVANNVYLTDRFKFSGSSSVSGKFNFAQNLNSVTPPAGYSYYSGFQVGTAYTVSGSDLAVFEQIIEGYNIADLSWGTADASAITISFWVRSSLTGTFGGCLKNAGYVFSYPFTYTISSANTWTNISVTVAAPTTGTWNTTTGQGIRVMLGLGAGATVSGTANGTWQAADYYSATGAVSVIGTASATFYVTGFQVEKGSSATTFDFRLYGTELLLCQRYYTSTVLLNIPVYATTTVYAMGQYKFPTTMRVAPTITADNITLMNEYFATTISGTYVPSGFASVDLLTVTAQNTAGTAFTANRLYRFNSAGNYYLTSEL